MSSEIRIEAQCETPCATVQVISYNWRKPQELVSTRKKANLDLAMSPRAAQAEAIFPQVDPDRRIPYGQMIFFPAGYELRSEWNSCQQRSVICELDFGLLAVVDDFTIEEYHLRSACDVRNSFLREAMLRLGREVVAPSFAAELIVESLSRAIALEIQMHFAAMGPGDVSGGRFSSQQWQRIEERITSVGTALPSLSELAGDCGMSVRHFSRSFRTATGLSVMEYAKQRRLELAKTLLADRRLSIKEIAYRSGFKGVSAFSVAFSRETGMSPRRFRDSNG